MPTNVLQAIGDQIGPVLHAVDPRQAVLGLINGNSLADPQPVKASFDNHMASRGYTKQADGSYYQGDPTPTPQPTVAPTIAPTTSPMMAGIGRNPDLPKKPMTDQVRSAIHSSAQEFQIPEGLLHDIGYSEGGFRADAKNDSPDGISAGVPRGLYQFKPGTWSHDLVNYANMPNSSLKNWTVNGQAPDINDPVANARAAAYLIAHGQLGRWDASKPNWGRFYKDEELKSYYSQTPGH